MLLDVEGVFVGPVHLRSSDSSEMSSMASERPEKAAV